MYPVVMKSPKSPAQLVAQYLEAYGPSPRPLDETTDQEFEERLIEVIVSSIWVNVLIDRYRTCETH